MRLTRNNFNKTRRLGRNPRKFIYTRKTYANPFFRHRKTRTVKTGAFSNKIKLLIFALAVIIIILGWLLFFSTLFKIQNIEVAGVGDSLTKEIENLARGLTENRLIGKNNLLLYDKSELTRQLNEKYYLQNLSVKKKLLHTLKITLQEKQPAAVWREDDKYYYLDNEGKVITQVDPLNVNGNLYPLIDNLTDIKIEEKTANIKQPTIEYTINLFNEFKDNNIELKIERFIIDKDINTIKIAVIAGPKIYFNTKEAIAPQIDKLYRIIKNKTNDDLKNKEYIDLRFNRAYYK